MLELASGLGLTRMEIGSLAARVVALCLAQSVEEGVVSVGEVAAYTVAVAGIEGAEGTVGVAVVLAAAEEE